MYNFSNRTYLKNLAQQLSLNESDLNDIYQTLGIENPKAQAIIQYSPKKEDIKCHNGI